MTGRTSARSSVNHDLASSPPRRGGRRPVTRTTRMTRSQSRELGKSDTNASTRQSAKTRGARQASVDSDTSIESKGRRRRKNVRATTAVARDLSIVAEDPEVDDEDDIGNTDVVRYTGNTQDREDEQYQLSRSPGGMSTMSGTTALTSHSAQEIADLDSEMVVKLIPSLFSDTSKLLDILLPVDVTAPAVETIVKELQVPGSSRGKMLRYIEETFGITRRNFGSELFINPTYILRKLFNQQDPGMGDFRPEIVLHAANIATLAKGLLIAQRDNPNTMPLLQRLDDLFPSPFLSHFEATSQYGASALSQVSFDFALELRTQTIISILKAFQDDPNYDPDQLISQIFYEPPAQRDPLLSTYEDSVINGEFRRIGGSADSWPTSKAVFTAQSRKISERVEAIRESFNVDPQAIEDGDYVDFDQLHTKFPWINFITEAMKWSQLRMEEINKGLEIQGGIHNVATMLTEEIQNQNGQIELNYEPPRAINPASKAIRSPLPAAVIPATTGKSLYRSSKSVEALLKTADTATLVPPSEQQGPGGSRVTSIPTSMPSTGLKKQASQGTQRTEIATTVAKSTSQLHEPYIEESEPLIFGDDFLPQATQERSTTELLADLHEAEAYQNKENQPLLEGKDPNAPKRRFVDRQPNAQRIAWSQTNDESEAGPSKRKRKRPNYKASADDTDTSEDGGFQVDERVLDISRRRHVYGARSQRATAAIQSPHKRVRVQSPDDSENERTPRASSGRNIRWPQLERQESEDSDVAGVSIDEDAALQASARASARADSEDEEVDEDEEGLPTSTPSIKYAVVSQTAKAIKRQKPPGAPRKLQQRIPWSEHDTELLIKYIAEIGCSWAAIEHQGGFEHERDQVALKDKARNIKVDFLRAGVELLPPGFDGISLGRKERDKVRAVGENPFRREGERPGGESRDPNSPMSSSQ